MRSKFACLKGNHHGVLTETKVGLFPVIDPTKGDPGAGADPGFDLNSFLSKDPSFLPSILKIGRVSFFCDADFFLKFHPTLTANNSGLKPSKLEKYHIFGILRTSAFTWSYPG